MKEIELIDAAGDTIYDHKLCFYKDRKQEGYRLKAEWLKNRFSEGLKYKMLYSPGDGVIATIEYIPGEYCWRAVEADGYMVIHCIFNEYKKYRNQGYGTFLVEESIRDAQKANMKGVAVVTRKGTWMVHRELFLKNGFSVVDKAPPDFELLTLRFDNSPLPSFPNDWEERSLQYGPGLTIVRSDQCPYITKSVKEIKDTAEQKYHLSPTMVELRDYRDAQKTLSAFAVFGIIYNGKLIADHPISNTRFMNIMNKEVK